MNIFPYRYLVSRNLIIALLYFCLGYVGLLLAELNDSISAFWLPSGLAVGMIVVYGYKIMPGIILGVLMINYTVIPSLITSSLIAAGNTAEAVVFLFLWQKYKIYSLLSVKNVCIFIGITFIACLVSAINGVVVLSLFAYAQAEYILFYTWWAGDVLGILILSPTLLFGQFDRRIAIIIMITTLFSLIIFYISGLIGLLIIPLIIAVYLTETGYLWAILTWSLTAIVVNSFSSQDNLLPLNIMLGGLAILTYLGVAVYERVSSD